jgi:hypothetical protein
MGRLKLHVLSPIDEPPAVPADDDALLLALSSPPPISDDPLPDELLAPPPVPDELPADVKAALLVAVDAPEQRYDALVKVPSFKAASVFQRAPSRAAPSLKASANLSASSEPAATTTSATTTTATSTTGSAEESLPPPPPLPHESISVVSPVLPAAPSVLSPRSLDSGVKPAPPRGAPPVSAATKAPADDDDDSSTESMDSEKAPMATAIKFGMLPSAQTDEDAGRFEDFFKVSGDVDIALLSARRRQQAADDSDSDDGKATPPSAGGAELPSGGATKSKSRRHGASSSSATAAAASSSSSSSSRHTSGSSTPAVSSSSSSRRSKTDKSDSKPAEIVKSGESTSSRRSRTNTRGRSGTTIVADGRPAPPDGAPPVVSPLALSTTADAPDPGSLSDSAPSPRRRRHHHSSKRRAELQAEIADIKRALSDPNTPDMAPYRARLQKAEAELRELDHIAPADDTVAVAVVAAAAASALASGSALPEAQKELLEKAQQMMGERQAQAQAQLATNALISPRRARGNTTSRTEAPEKVVIPAPSPADVLRELKIRKMLLVGQIGTLKKQLATPTLSGDERKRAEGSLKLIEADMVKLDDDIKARTVESAAPIAIVQTPRK